MPLINPAEQKENSSADLGHKPRIQLSSFDEGDTGCLKEQQLGELMRTQAIELELLEDMQAQRPAPPAISAGSGQAVWQYCGSRWEPSFLQHYCNIAARKIIFFHGKNGSLKIKELLTSPLMKVTRLSAASSSNADNYSTQHPTAACSSQGRGTVHRCQSKMGAVPAQRSQCHNISGCDIMQVTDRHLAAALQRLQHSYQLRQVHPLLLQECWSDDARSLLLRGLEMSSTLMFRQFST
ncbi:hypothetical protein QJQ45_008995 [Haematococcus lacustris]|nr:hypothetical protein QJQ45_008995 [Haematococcus lacustris]